MTSVAQEERRKLLRKIRDTLIVIALIIGLPILIYIGFTIEPPPTGGLEGELQANGTSLGDFTTTPDECWCSERLTDVSFRGVALIATQGAGSNIVVRVEEGRNGGAVHLEKRGSGPQSQSGIVLSKNDCSRFNVSFRRDKRQGAGSYKVDYIWGRVELSCSPGGGGRVKADVTFDGCSCDRGIGTRSIYR